MKSLKLFACCIPVKGINRSVICDLQRGVFDFIPNILMEILVDFNGKTIDDIKNSFANQYHGIIDEYINFLEEKEYIFFTDKPELFPEMDLSWKHPSYITNAIIDFNIDSNFDVQDIFNQLSNLGCKAIQIRFLCKKEFKEIETILEKGKNLGFNSIDLIVKYQEEINYESLIFLISNYNITNIIIHSSQKDEVIKVSPEENLYITYSKQEVNSATHCGYVDPSYFISSIPMFTESLSFNSCLNRKISVDENGEIKNCPSMTFSYGNISNTSLYSVILKEKFKQYWTINKDQIAVCKGCEFRYMCTDCRAFISTEDDLFSKPSKCTYSPEKMTWE